MKKLEWYEGREVTEQERKAVREALCDINYYDVADDAERVQEWIDDDTISIMLQNMQAMTVIYLQWKKQRMPARNLLDIRLK